MVLTGDNAVTAVCDATPAVRLERTGPVKQRGCPDLTATYRIFLISIFIFIPSQPGDFFFDVPYSTILLDAVCFGFTLYYCNRVLCAMITEHNIIASRQCLVCFPFLPD